MDSPAGPPMVCSRCGSTDEVEHVTWPDATVLPLCRSCAREDPRFAQVPPSMRPVSWSDEDERNDVERPYQPPDRRADG